MCESGKFYGKLIDPLLAPMRKHVAKEIDAGQSVIDIACGTGAQAFELAAKGIKVTGIDHSESMIQYARQVALKKKLANVDFHLGDATELNSFKTQHYDIATLSLALHQFPPELHPLVLSEMKSIAPKIIVVDYAVPLPSNYVGYGSKFIEFLAGREHHKNFLSYYRLGGLNKIMRDNDLEIKKSVLFGKDSFQLVICTPR